MPVPLLTLVHVVISVVGIAAGFGALAGLLQGTLLGRWTAVFLVTTTVTSLTGFLFPMTGVTPGIVPGVLSLITLALAGYALYIARLAGPWRGAYVTGAVLSLYFNTFVLVAQLFQKTPALAELGAPAFGATQFGVLLAFVWLGIAAGRQFYRRQAETL